MKTKALSYDQLFDGDSFTMDIDETLDLICCDCCHVCVLHFKTANGDKDLHITVGRNDVRVAQLRKHGHGELQREGEFDRSSKYELKHR